MDPAQRFAQIIAGPPTPWSLDVMCSLVSAAFTHRLRTDEVLTALDDLADSCAEPTIEGVLAAMRPRLTGNVTDYYDPRNSFLDEVLERGVGLPITLSVIAMEVGRRVGAPIVGIGPPRHFMVRDPGRQLVGDPFHGGTVYDRAELQTVWPRLMGEEVPFDDIHLLPVPERAILIRMLNNLRGLYARAGEPRAMWALAIMRGAFVELVQEAPEHAVWMRSWN